MNDLELRLRGEAAFGGEWDLRLRELLRVSYGTMRRWRLGEGVIPDHQQDRIKDSCNKELLWRYREETRLTGRRPPIASLVGKRILVVEDEPWIAEILRHMLWELGADILGPAASAAEAFTEIGRTRPDAAILDVRIQGGISDAIARCLKEMKVPYLFATGYTHTLTGFAHDLWEDRPIVQKPYAYEALAERLSLLLPEEVMV